MTVAKVIKALEKCKPEAEVFVDVTIVHPDGTTAHYAVTEAEGVYYAVTDLDKVHISGQPIFEEKTE